MRALLDVSVLMALLDTAHVHHMRARTWLQAHIEAGWASCPLTQNGCIRILSQSSYPGSEPPAHVASRLRTATETPWHEFWPDDVSLLDPQSIEWPHVLGSRQLTDVYLLSLAVHRSGCLVTFDRSVSTASVKSARDIHLVTI